MNRIDTTARLTARVAELERAVTLLTEVVNELIPYDRDYGRGALGEKLGQVELEIQP